MIIRLPHPIERMRGGGIVVTVECSEGTETVSNFAIATSDSEADIQKAMDTAVEKCKSQLEVANKNHYPDIVISLTQDAVMKGYKEGNLLDEETLKLLQSPCDEHKQKELNILCETLGIEKINTSAKGYTMLQTTALIAGLKKWAKSLESTA